MTWNLSGRSYTWSWFGCAGYLTRAKFRSGYAGHQRAFFSFQEKRQTFLNPKNNIQKGYWRNKNKNWLIDIKNLSEVQIDAGCGAVAGRSLSMPTHRPLQWVVPCHGDDDDKSTWIAAFILHSNLLDSHRRAKSLQFVAQGSKVNKIAHNDTAQIISYYYCC